MAENVVDDEVWNEFRSVVNMSSVELREALLHSPPATEALPDHAGPERSRALVEILGKDRSELTDDDAVVIRSVVEEIRGLRADGAEDSEERTAKLRSLGHDPGRAS